LSVVLPSVTVSGGFAVVQPNSVMSINAVEGYPIEDFSSEAIRAQIAEASKVANGSGSEQDIAEAKIELEVRFLDLLRLYAHLLTQHSTSGSRKPPDLCEVDVLPQINPPCSILRDFLRNEIDIEVCNFPLSNWTPVTWLSCSVTIRVDVIAS
jgi:hypothetical protein